jgi:hypothetical protein
MTEDLADLAGSGNLSPELRKAVRENVGGDPAGEGILVDQVIRLLTAHPFCEEPLGIHLCGLSLESTHDAIPLREVSVKARNALQRLRVETWEDLATARPADIVGLRTVGLKTLNEILMVAATRCLRASSSARDPASIRRHDAPKPLESAGDDGGLYTAPTFTEVLNALAIIAEWGLRERNDTTLGPVFEELGNRAERSPDVAIAWAQLSDTKLSQLVRPSSTNVSLCGLFDDLMSRLRGADRAVFAARSLSPGAPTLRAIGERFGLTRERVRQIHGRAERQVESLLSTERFAPLRWKAYSLRAALGASVPVSSEAYRSVMDSVVGVCNPDQQVPLARFLLRLAGYYEDAGWMVRKDAGDLNLLALEEAADEYGLIDALHVDQMLDAAGIAPTDHDAMLERIGGLRRLGDRIALWKGSVVDKAVRVLAVRGTPASADELAAVIGEGYSIRALRNRLFADARVARVGKNQWALRAWNLEEYTGIADEIAEEIERRGGTAQLSFLVDVLTARFGVAETSVRAYAQTPRFVVEDGVVRLRRADESIGLSAKIADTKGCFQDSSDSVTFCIPVDKDVLRGSGRALPAAVALFLGVLPGGERVFRAGQSQGGEDMSLLVTWPIASVAGPALGSTRALAVRQDATEGDLLRLRFDRLDGVVRTARVRARELGDLTPLEQLEALTGLSELDSSTVGDRLAAALGVDRSRLRSQLHRRGDASLISLLPTATMDPGLGTALAELAGALAGADVGPPERSDA